jgi:metal-responsive CopG/Arc/MetJ family transcriptional regulator
MSPTTRVQVVLDDETLRLLDRLEQMTGASRSEHIRRAVSVYAKTLRLATKGPEQVKKGRPKA